MPFDESIISGMCVYWRGRHMCGKGFSFICHGNRQCAATTARPAATLHRSSQSMPANTAFQLQISIRQAASGDPVAFKVDGERFEGGSRTLKFATNTRYRVALTTKPPTEFHSFHLAGCDLRLHSEDLKSGEYCSEWNTTGIDVCKKGTRQNINITLQGPGGLLKRQLQCKFYQKDDSHAEWGHKMKTLEWSCGVDGQGNITVTDENFK